MIEGLPILAAFLAMNAVGYLMMGQDKKAAQRQEYRTSERTLMGIALLGGAIGIYGGMRQFHHKTKKPLFYVGVPVLILVNLMGLGFYSASLLIR